MSSTPTSINDLSRPNTPAFWSQYLHRRVMRLLLQHDQHLFQSHFRRFYTQSTLPTLPLFQLYDSYLKLLLLKDELLGDILPRIRRQLSTQNNQLSTQEEAPTRGEIDWSRTITRTLNETPDLPPLRFDTNQQQRSLLNAENVFVVAILLQYRQAVQDILKKDLSDEILSDQERQQFTTIEEHIDRELAVSYNHTLLKEAQQADIDQLADQVRRRLPPGNSAYRDIFHWWEQLNELQIGKALDHNHLTLISKRTDDKSNSWLYELWITLELLHLLDDLQSIKPTDILITGNQIRFRFTWNERHFFFTYHRQLLRENEIAPGWNNIPATNARYTIEREYSLEVRLKDSIVWREPPVCLDSSYESASNGYTIPLQTLLGEMRLQGTKHAALFAPTFPEPASEELYTIASRDASMYTEGMSYNLNDPSIRLCRLVPGMDLQRLQGRLKALLDDLTSTEVLPERSQPACHGIILDEDTINDGRSRPVSYNVLCPKPHIGEGAFDLVNDKVHCLKDPRLCHIYGQAKIPPFVVRASTRDAMDQQSSDIRNRADDTLKQAEQNGEEEKAEQLRNHIFLGIGRAVEQYVKLRGNTDTIEAYFEEWIFGDYWRNHPRCLTKETRDILLSGAYVWDEYKQTALDDWAAPAVQFCRALEAEIKRRIHDHYPGSKDYYTDVRQKGFDVPRENMTLGSVETIYAFKDQDLFTAHPNDKNKIRSAQHNWILCKAIVAHSKGDLQEFEDILRCMVNEHISHNRNKLAHGGSISQNIAQELRDTIIGRRDKPGILYRLVECLEPKR
jgi:hypothetical protein